MADGLNGKVKNAELATTLRTLRDAHRLSQNELAELSGVRRDYIGQLEYGHVGVPHPQHFNNLKRVLGFVGWQLLEVMGYETDAHVEGTHPRLARAIGCLTPERQNQLAKILEMEEELWAS